MKRLLPGLLALFATAVAQILLSQPALAAYPPGPPPTNRGQWHGYFTNRCDDWGNFVFQPAAPGADAIPLSKVYDWQSYITFIRDAWNSGGSQRAGAAFVILLMDGYKLPPVGMNAVGPGSTYFQKFSDIVTYYGEQGWIKGIDNTTQFFAYYYNTYLMSSPGDPFCNQPSTDDAWYSDTGSTIGAIIFHDPSAPPQDSFVIRRACGNPLGSDQLTIPNFNVQVTANRHGSPYLVTPGQTYTVGVTLQNTGPTASINGALEVSLPTGVDRPCAPWCHPAGQPGTTPTDYATRGVGFDNNGANLDPGASSPYWAWYTSPIPGSSPVEDTYLTFKVSAGDVGGQILTFDAYFYPSTWGGAVSHDSITFQVVSIRTPTVVGQNGDVQAGGGLCDAAGNWEPTFPSNGYVKGYSAGGSYDQYVVSAGSGTNTITNFGSNGALSGAAGDILDVGQNGAYANVCRTDLVSVANTYRINNGTGYSTRGPGDYDISSWSGLYYIDGAASIHGTVNNKLTIVSNGGALTINAPGITLANPSPVPATNMLPSLGILAADDVDIDPAVTNVDAYIFSDAAVDTCYIPPSGSYTPCENGPLTIHGFIMANSIAFDRIGAHDTNGVQPGEDIILNPQIYLNPPQFFDAAVDENVLSGQGEKPPLY